MASNRGDSSFIVDIPAGKSIFTWELWWIFSPIYSCLQIPQVGGGSHSAFYSLIITLIISTSYL